VTRARRRGRTLSLRLWLVLTVVAVVVSATVAEIALSRSMGAWQQHADHARLAAVRAVLGTDPARWGDPAWQRQTEPALRALGVEAQLVHVAAGSSGQLVYTTAGARALLGVPVVGTTGTGTLATSVQQARSRTTWAGGLAQATTPCGGWLPHPRSQAMDRTLDTGSLRAVTRLPLWVGRGACERADEVTSQQWPNRGRG